MKGNDELLDQIKNDPTVSTWLKEQVKQVERRDIVDAINDAELLLIYLHKKLSDLTGY